ncbi:MAG: type II toxin-antitoxin system HicA family toxin [Candidatus Magnetominusculus sp. LBB02]|nr:type II toxin-antitoxin system HicA family toxin [Candidatus Magnetominusculus sp. LBB02]
MHRLRLCSGVEAVSKFKRMGWIEARQKGSHVMMTKEGYEYTLSIPLHSELGPGILKKLIKQANISVEEFNNL